MTLFGDDHVRRYEQTDGAEGYNWENGTTILILTTTGRKSGSERKHALIYRDWDGKQLIVASKGGADAPPAWYLNLQNDPEVQVQIKGDKFAAHARIASPDEKPAMWTHMTEVWPAYDTYQTKTERAIPIVVLERAAADTSKPADTSNPAETSDETKDKFKEALDRKRTRQHANNGDASGDSKVHSEHGRAGAKRNFRRKSGG